MPGSVPTVKHGEYSMIIWAAISWYSAVPIITLHCRITVREHVDRLSNQVYPIIQTLFPNNDVVFQDDSAPIQTAHTVHSVLEEHEGELQHLPWAAQSSDFNVTESL
jgi:hypothetical protein